MLHLLYSSDFNSEIEFNSFLSNVEKTNNSIVLNLSELMKRDSGIAKELETLIDYLEKSFSVYLEGYFILNRQIESGNLKKQNLYTSSKEVPTFLQPLFLRLGRAKLISSPLEFLKANRETSSFADYFSSFKTIMKERDKQRTYRETFPKYIRLILFPRFSVLDSSDHKDYVPMRLAKVILHCRVLIAELRKTSWPVDVFFDPNAKPLHRVERNGKLIGTYSVGLNGVDDGGIKGSDDYYIPIYGNR
jgi:hypothetical protein